MPNNRVDPLSWFIYIDEPAPQEPYHELWANPSRYAVMRPVIHESIHFWHSISTHKIIELAFDCLKSFNAMRFAYKKGESLLNIKKGWTFDGYQPFKKLKEFNTKGIPYLVSDAYQSDYSEEYEKIFYTEPFFSPSQIFEGVSRYWDQVISSGLSTNEQISSLINKDSPTYSEAYKYATEVVGDVAFIIFPMFGYFSLCTKSPVKSFRDWLEYFKHNGFHIPRGINYQDAWLIAWDNMIKWDGFVEPPYAPLATYKTLHKKYVNWKWKYHGLLPEDFPFIGHPYLSVWMQKMMDLSRTLNPNRSDYEREVIFIKEFIFPGNPFYRLALAKTLTPPLIMFSDNNYWKPNFENYHEDNPAFYSSNMAAFSVLMGVAYGLIAKSEGKKSKNACPCASCCIHPLGLCNYVVKFPKNPENCEYLPMIKKEFGI
jgi:hypothetical protein